MTTDRKSPIKNLPVRLPGQSTETRISHIVFEKVMMYVFAAGFLCFWAWMEWTHYVGSLEPCPWIATGLAGIAVVVAVWKLVKGRREVKRLTLGRIGEEAVGQYLEEKLRPLGYQVLHDIPGDGFNVDHVVIGPSGIYAIETKTHSKPAKGASSVKYDGEHVTVNGFAPDRDPVVQAKAEAHWLGDLIEESTGRRFPVQPIVIYPGWFVEKMPENSEVWVLNEKVLPTFVQNARTHLAPEDINLITYHLKRYVIAKTKEERAKRS
jgi:hypothetical protein